MSSAGAMSFLPLYTRQSSSIFRGLSATRVLCGNISVDVTRARRRSHGTATANELNYSIWVVFQLLLICQSIEGVGLQLMGLTRTHRVSPSCGTSAVFDSQGPLRIHVEELMIRVRKRIGRGGEVGRVKLRRGEAYSKVRRSKWLCIVILIQSCGPRGHLKFRSEVDGT